jgi:hypothetical protein
MCVNSAMVSLAGRSQAYAMAEMLSVDGGTFTTERLHVTKAVQWAIGVNRT